jgi:hypothetical protein
MARASAAWSSNESSDVSLGAFPPREEADGTVGREFMGCLVKGRFKGLPHLTQGPGFGRPWFANINHLCLRCLLYLDRHTPTYELSQTPAASRRLFPSTKINCRTAA